MDMSLGELQELVMDREACVLRFMGLQRVGHDWATELNWTEAWKDDNSSFVLLSEDCFGNLEFFMVPFEF